MNRRFKILIIIIICSFLLTFIIITCDRVKNPAATDNQRENVIVPLAVGNTWTYEDCHYAGGVPIESSKYAFQVRIIDEITLSYEGQTYTAAVRGTYYPGSNYTYQSKWLEWNGEDGLYSLGGLSSDDTLICKYLEERYPVEIGDTWQVPFIAYSVYEKEFYFKDTLTYECISLDEEYETPIGTFKCIVYHYQRWPVEDIHIPEEIYEYYVPGIGLIARTIGKRYDPHITQIIYDLKIN